MVQVRKMELSCKWCGAKLPEKIKAYKHRYGWYVRGKGKWWLYITCPKCGYDWNLEKLGLPRSAIVTEESWDYIDFQE